MDKEYNDIDTSIKKALDIMESPSGLSEEEINEYLKDEKVLSACRDIMDTKQILQRNSNNEFISIDIEAELERFKAKHTKRKVPYLKVMIGVITMAAILAGIIFLLPDIADIPPATDNITIFKADNTPQQITLQTENGKKMILGEVLKNKTTTAKEYLDYSRTKENSTGNANTHSIQTHTLTIPRGQSYEVILCDGTKIWLNANSRLIYPTAFINNERVVYLEGEAYFKVTPNKQKPFIVKTQTMQTRVLGTEFNIRCYNPEDSHIVLIKGKVEVSNTKGGAYTTLVPGEDAHLQADGNFILTEVDLDNYIYWKDGYFYYDDMTLKEIMQNLGRWYNINIEFRNEEAMNYKMHFVADRKQSLEYTIELLNSMKKVTVTQRSNTLTVD